MSKFPCDEFGTLQVEYFPMATKVLLKEVNVLAMNSGGVSISMRLVLTICPSMHDEFLMGMSLSFSNKTGSCSVVRSDSPRRK